MPVKLSESRIIELFNELKFDTNNFTKLDVNIFRKSPQKLCILRLMLNLSQAEFSLKVGVVKSLISQWENRVFNQLPQSKLLENVIIKFTPLIKNLSEKEMSLDQVLENFRRFKVLSEGGTLKASEALMGLPWEKRQLRVIKCLKKKPRSEDELVIRNLLLNEKYLLLNKNLLYL